MGTSANLLVIQGDRTLGLHTSYDGYPENVLGNVAAPIALLGLDLLRTRFAAATLLPEYDETVNQRQRESDVFKNASAAYLQACEDQGVRPYDLGGLLHYEYGTPDFAHSGAGLLYGDTHIDQSGFFNPKDRRSSSDYLLDLAAGTLQMNYGLRWTIDLAALAGKDPAAVFQALSEYDYDAGDEDDTEIAVDGAIDQPHNQALQSALAQLPAYDPSAPAPILARMQVTDFGMEDEGEDDGVKAILVRVHPDDFILIRLLSQAIHQAALSHDEDPEFKALLACMKIERTDECAGLLFTRPPARLAPVIEAAAVAMTQSFGATHTVLWSSGASTVRGPHSTYTSSGWAGLAPGEEAPEDDDQRLPAPEDLTDANTLDFRMKTRETWIADLLSGTAAHPESMLTSLRSERYLSLVSLDPQAYEQLTRPEVETLLGPIDMTQCGELMVGMAQVESTFNAHHLRARFAAMPSSAQALIRSNVEIADRHRLAALGIHLSAPARPRGP